MKISRNTLRFINTKYESAGDPAPQGVADLVERIGAQLGAIEEVVDFGSRFADVVVARVMSCDNHPNADRLHVCKLDDDGATPNVERDENGYVQVVCGAPNVREGLLVAWLPPGATVPESMVEGEPFVLEARPLRGVVSNGMLASPRELTLGDSHDGILEINRDVQPGTPFADAFNLRNDTILDIENKMFTHRPDCFGWLGVAREIEGIYGRAYKSPAWYTLKPAFPEVEAEELPLEVHNQLPALVPRFMAVALRDVAVQPSPLSIQIHLAKHGIRPINNIVDYTNFFMLETGQPLHAYDYDKVKAKDAGAAKATLTVRYPEPNEKLTLLNGKEIQPRQEAIMIATQGELIGVGGVMGGADCEVDGNTTNIIIECASFDMYSIRRTSMAHGLFTDAVTRNNKGQSPLQTAAVLAKIVDEVRQFAGGKVASAVIDDNHLEAAVMQRGSLYAPVKLGARFVNSRLGLQLSAQDMATLLRNVEFLVELDGDDLVVTAPFWRTDIEIAEDIVEEIGRLYGFDRLPLSLPHRDLTPAPKNPLFELKSRLRTLLSKGGANEVLTYNFVHGNLLQKVGQDSSKAFTLANALSPDLQYYRMSLSPSLLDKVHANIKAGFDTFALFEMNKSHVLGVTDAQEPALPAESNRLSLVFASKKPQEGAAYYRAKYYLQNILSQVHGGYEIVAWKDLGDLAQQALKGEQKELPQYAALAAPFDLDRSGFVIDTNEAESLPIAIVGEYRRRVAKDLKLPEYTAGFEVILDCLAVPDRSPYQMQSRYPATEQDICLKVSDQTSYAQVLAVASATLQARQANEYVSLMPVDIYQRDDEPDFKQITLRLTIASYEKTLRDEEVAGILDAITTEAAEKLHATRI